MATSGSTLLLALVSSIALRQFPVGELPWWFGVTALAPIRGLIVGWTVVAIIVAACCRRSLSNPFLAVLSVNLCVVVLMLLMTGKVVA